MKTIDSAKEMQEASVEWQREGKTVGFVPTMGFLHEGHLSLMRLARSRCDVLVVSIFVNPTQFGPGEDLERYPRDIKRDTSLCVEESVDVLFLPRAEDVYAPDHSVWVEETAVSEGLCGASRPGHFRGVTTVIAKLFNIVRPAFAVFGQKDAQQLRVIRRMVLNLNFPVEILEGPTIREDDGVAMSSRNAYLNEDQRIAARCLSQSLQLAEDLFRSGCRDADTIKKDMLSLISGTPSVSVDYVEVVDSADLTPVAALEGPALVAVAARIGSVRLIDNCVLQTEDGQQ